MKTQKIFVSLLILAIIACKKAKTNEIVPNTSEPILDCATVSSILDTNKVICNFNLDSIKYLEYRNFITPEMENEHNINISNYFTHGGPSPKSLYRFIYFTNDTLVEYLDSSNSRSYCPFKIKHDSLFIYKQFIDTSKIVVYTFDKNCKGKLIGENGERLYLDKKY